MLRRGALALLALATVLSTLAVIAAPVVADHSYSHRYVVFGRVIDSLGQPAMGWTATGTISGPAVLGDCPNFVPMGSGVADSDRSGDFFLCYHMHSFSGGTITVFGPGSSQTFPLDVNLRKTFVHIRLDTVWPTKDATTVAVFHTQYTVRGRVWQPQPGAVVEGNTVNGIVMTTERVSIAFAYNGGSTRSGSSTTNNYGDYGSLLALTSNLTEGTLEVGAAGFRSRITADPEFMVSDEANLVLPAPPNPLVEFLLTYYWVLLAGTGVVIASWYVLTHARPRKAARDVARIPGIGRSKAEALRNVGVGTIDQLATASPKDLADRTGLSTKEAKRLIRKAKGVLEAERTGPASADKD